MNAVHRPIRTCLVLVRAPFSKTHFHFSITHCPKKLILYVNPKLSILLTTHSPKKVMSYKINSQRMGLNLHVTAQ